MDRIAGSIPLKRDSNYVLREFKCGKKIEKQKLPIGEHGNRIV